MTDWKATQQYNQSQYDGTNPMQTNNTNMYPQAVGYQQQPIYSQQYVYQQQPQRQEVRRIHDWLCWSIL
ncbi:unnamed protein product, partial [Rotaria sp. Silwood2]